MANVNNIIFSVIVTILVIALVFLVKTVLSLRRVVPTNMVHIVQSSKNSTPFGRGKPSGNTYYAWPSWIPIIGVTVTQFPESNFQVSLSDYSAYDSTRLPFIVDITAFFRIDNAETAAQRIATFEELKLQLISVLQGSVRRILATNKLEDIMQERASLGTQFTDEVTAQIKEWGVLPVKTIEFMDIRDAKDASVISNIMAKEQSRIEKESRVTVAINTQDAELKEIDAQRTVEVQRQDAAQQVGLRTAEKDKEIGIANEKAKQHIQEEAKLTAERNMDVLKVQEVRNAEIIKEVNVVKANQDKEVKVVEAQASKESKVLIAEGSLAEAKLNSEGITAEGIARGNAEKAILMAPVETQITLAKEIGENNGYQNYLISIKQVEVGRDVGIELAKAMQNADLKVIANSGDIQSGITQLGDVFSSKGGTNLTSMLAALAQSSEGKALLSKFITPK